MSDIEKKKSPFALIHKGFHFLQRYGVRYTGGKVLQYIKNGGRVRNEEIQENLARVVYRLGEPVVILATKHTLYIAHLLEASLKRLSVPVQIITEEPVKYTKKLHIVICPQMFRHMPSRYIAFQMEQTVSSRWLTKKYIGRLRNSYAVFDYSLVNIQYFKEKTDLPSMFYYLPVDYIAAEHQSQEEPVYDVLFYGDINNERRRAMLDELSQSFRVKVVSEVFGEQLYEQLRKAKVVVNLHYYENAMLETTRIYEVLSLGSSVVVSESSSDPREEERLKGIVDFVDVGDVEQLRTRIAYWLEDENRRREYVEKTTQLLNERASAFDYYFYRFLLANGWLSFEQFYDLAGAFVHFNGERVCLSLPEETARREEFDRDNHYGFEVFPGLRHIRGWTGCGLSYKFIMKKAKEQGLEKLLVCEDDVFFPTDFEERFSCCLDYLKEHPDWDIFQGLMADVGNVTVSHVDREKGQSFVHIDHMVSAVFNLYKECVYDCMISWDETNNDVQTNTIDRSLEAKVLKIVATTPFLVGHKEELDSTIWGFNNSQYSDMIAQSSEKLERLAEAFWKNE